MLMLVGCSQPGTATEKAAGEKTIQISIEVKFNGHGEDRTLECEVAEGTTVFGALRQLNDSNQISAQLSGSGETGFVSSIGNVAQDKDGQGWKFRVNQELGKASCDMYSLSEGDHVIWSFGRYKPE